MSISVEHLTFGYGRRTILEDVSFSVESGSFLSVLGPNGVGKSTLLRCILGLERSFVGTVQVEGTPVSALTPKALAQKIAYIPQSHYPSFHFTVEDMVLMGTSNGLSMVSMPGKVQKQLAREAMEQMQISKLSQRMFHQLSGGERQLVLMARALAQKTNILVFDEPAANLDFGNQVRVLRMMKQLSEQGITVIQTTHSPEHAYAYSHRILALKDGQVLGFGTPQTLICTELMSRLYGISLNVASYDDDRFRFCIPT